ncbi:hypothetical protein GR11A_00154 [Vibrio phage vB_VcorM_GR11A]|nr:hypothetical protein GR11A_00154 [Vibrio phage vB_VcorM_GR11A]
MTHILNIESFEAQAETVRADTRRQLREETKFGQLDKVITTLVKMRMDRVAMSAITKLLTENGLPMHTTYLGTYFGDKHTHALIKEKCTHWAGIRGLPDNLPETEKKSNRAALSNTGETKDPRPTPRAKNNQRSPRASANTVDLTQETLNWSEATKAIQKFSTERGANFPPSVADMRNVMLVNGIIHQEGNNVHLSRTTHFFPNQEADVAINWAKVRIDPALVTYIGERIDG